VLVRAVLGAAPGAAATAAAAAGKLPEGNPKVLGELLFSQYVLPFEALSLLLLVAMVGVILLSKKDLK
jgi:NADH-quinone oxidoreductase subunit J